MKTKLAIVAAALLVASAPASSSPMSVNVSGPGAVNPFTGYRMTYYDKDRNSCTFRFNLPGDGLAYLTADKECPSYVTEKRVFLDAQKSLKHMNTVSSAFTFSEYHGDDGYGNKVERAELRYRCASTTDITVSNPIEWAGVRRNNMFGFVFMPIRDIHMDEWYELDLAGYPNIYEAKVGAWQPGENMTIVASYMGRLFTIPYEKTSKCQYHRAH